MNATPSSTAAIELGNYLAVIRRRKAIIAAAVVLVTLAAAAVFASRGATQPYVATAKVLDRVDTGTTGKNSTSGLLTDAQLAHSRPVLNAVRTTLKTDRSVNQLLDRSTATVVPNSNIIAIKYTASDKTQAITSANAIADTFVSTVTKQQAGEQQTTVSALNGQIDQVTAQLKTAAAQLVASPDNTADHASAASAQTVLVSELTDLRNQLNKAQQPLVPVATVVERAEDATGGGSDVLRNTALAVPVGLLLGLLLAFARDRMDTRLHEVDRLESVIGAPILGSVPWSRRRRLRRKKSDDRRVVALADIRDPDADLYRRLRSSLQFLVNEDGLRSILVTTPRSLDAVSTVLANLAVMFARAGRSVAVVSFDTGSDLRQLLGLRGDGQLDDVMAGRLGAAEALQSTPDAPNLRALISSGAGDDAEVLNVDAVRRTLRQLHRDVDLVLVLARPTLESADAVDLAPLVDGILLVVDGRTMDRDELETAQVELHRAGGAIVAGVVAEAPKRVVQQRVGTSIPEPRHTPRPAITEPLPVPAPTQTAAAAPAPEPEPELDPERERELEPVAPSHAQEPSRFESSAANREHGYSNPMWP